MEGFLLVMLFAIPFLFMTVITLAFVYGLLKESAAAHR